MDEFSSYKPWEIFVKDQSNLVINEKNSNLKAFFRTSCLINNLAKSSLNDPNNIVLVLLILRFNIFRS